jgi:hypothetical protein
MGGHDTAGTLPLSLRKPKISSFCFSNRDELRHRLAALGDDDSLSLGLHCVHDLEAAGFELAGGYGFHGGLTAVKS